MESLKRFISLCLFSFFLGAKSLNQPQHDNIKRMKPNRLFVFGDSYVDTGNIRKSLADAWKFPYGVTFPRKPAGRFSDGRVSTDYLARYLGIKSPIPYTWRAWAGKARLMYGMNYAYGGTGVFKTFKNPLPNMTTQIDYFQRILAAGNLYTPSDLSTSIALLSVAGNDYNTFLHDKRPMTEYLGFVKEVVAQTEINMRRLHKLGVKKIAIASLQPLGCLPSVTIRTSFQRCNESEKASVIFHNTLLQQAVDRLNNETKPSTFVIIDLYNAFSTVLMDKTRFLSPLRPCCLGITSYDHCSNVDEMGQKKYTMCDNPKDNFFWDVFHPSQEGWRSVYSVLEKNLTHILI